MIPLETLLEKDLERVRKVVMLSRAFDDSSRPSCVLIHAVTLAVVMLSRAFDDSSSV